MGYEEGDRIPAGTCDNWDAHMACSGRTPPKAGRQWVLEAAIPCVHVCGAVCRGWGTYHVCTLLEVPLHLKQLCSVCPGPARSVSGAGRGSTGRQPSRGGRRQEAQDGPSVRGQQRPRPAAQALQVHMRVPLHTHGRPHCWHPTAIHTSGSRGLDTGVSMTDSKMEIN